MSFVKIESPSPDETVSFSSSSSTTTISTMLVGSTAEAEQQDYGCDAPMGSNVNNDLLLPHKGLRIVPSCAGATGASRGSPSPKSITSLHLAALESECDSNYQCTAYGLYENQVGGHGNILRGRPGRVVKPSNVKERQFYDLLVTQVERELRPLYNSNLTPAYYGSVGKVRLIDGDWTTAAPTTAKITTRKQQQQQHNTWIEMEDINYGLQSPCIMDVKMGTRHYDDDASPAKRAKSMRDARDTTSLRTGLRIIGARVECEDGSVVQHGKEHGKALTVADLSKELEWFFGVHSDANSDHMSSALRVNVVKSVIAQLEHLRIVMADIEEWNFYSSSLLFVYDAKEKYSMADKRSLLGHKQKNACVKMIDFAHAVPCQPNSAREDGYLFGLTNLIDLLSSIIDRHV